MVGQSTRIMADRCDGNAVAVAQRGQPLALGVVYLDADCVSARVARSYSAPLGRGLIIHNMSIRRISTAYKAPYTVHLYL